MEECTLVLGVDRKHLAQLAMVWRTWRRHKPSLAAMPLLVFHDCTELEEDDVRDVIGHHPDVRYFPWPPPGVVHGGDPTDKWFHPQRYRMLSGFVHVPAMHCRTKWWLKIDTDVVAIGDDDWIDPAWFDKDPAIVSHAWGYTKPADQMEYLDYWVQCNEERLEMLRREKPLKLVPRPGSSILKHPRIISWCAFFNSANVKLCAQWASQTVGEFRLPVPSQDGYLWYCAARMGWPIERVNMKLRGWQHWATERNIREASKAALA